MSQEIITACTALTTAYAHHVDFGEYEAFAALFAEDAVLDIGRRMEGRAAILGSMAHRPAELRSRHVITNVRIQVQDERTASGICYLTLYRHVGPESLDPAPIDQFGPAAVGHYADEFRLTADGWRFAHRSLAIAFRNPEHF